MFRSHGLFRDIRCPYNQECVLPDCMFAHPIDVEHMSVPNDLSGGGLMPGHDGAEETETPRKRRKLDDGAKPQQLKQDVTVDKHSVQPSSPKPLEIHTPALSSRTRAVSPPSKRHSTLDVRSGAHATQTASQSSKSTVSSKALAPKTTQKPVKVETLNPRMLASSKTPHNIRLKLVQLLHEQFVRLNGELSADASESELPLVLSPQALITLALDAEERAGLEKPAIHSSAVKNTILRYKKMSVSDWKKERQIELEKATAKVQAQAGKVAKHISKESKPIETGLPPDLEIAILPKLYTPTPTEHGFVNIIPSESAINAAKAGVAAAHNWEQCDRCRARFQVFPDRRESDGALCSGGTCTYHWGKAFFPDRAATDVRGSKRTKRYSCCGEALGDSSGCTTAQTHVFKESEAKRLASILNFVETPENCRADEDNALAVDAEMGYTTLGFELIRLSATLWPSGAPFIDVLVRPFGKILCLNSRWSGVLPSQLSKAPLLTAKSGTAEYEPAQLAGIEKLYAVESPAVARTLLLRFLTPRTALIAHGAENDLNALRLIHPCVIDTALLFPHPRGLPYRNSLRSLAFIHLGRTIQAGGGLLASEGNSVAAGHDPKEDARSAGDLVLFAVKREWERMQASGWKLEDGRLVPPKQQSQCPLKPQGKAREEVTDVVLGTKRKVERFGEGAEVVEGD